MPIQSWYEKKWHRISGCGPTTAALITMYMASAFPKSCAPLYPYALPAIKSDFIVHMNEVREFVKPGGMGLTSTTFFAERTVAFAQSKGVKLQSYIVHTNLNAQNAFGFLQEAVKEQYMPALLILKNPFKELSDFHWHWMAVTDLTMRNKV